MRVLRGKPPINQKTFNEILADSKNTRQALRRLVRRGSLPPAVEKIVRDLLRETSKKSAAFSVDVQVQTMMEKLSQEPLPENLRRYTAAEDLLPSRVDQIKQASEFSTLPGKVAADNSAYLLDTLGHIPEMAIDGSTPPGQREKETKQARRAQIQSYAKYTSSTFQPRSGPAESTGTKRSYKVAIRSSRAARGIAIGGQMGSAPAKPTKAIWMPNARDDRFGRLYVEFPQDGAKPLVGISRVMFSDSVLAAVDALWQNYHDEANFIDGEILTLMSMDPEAEITREAGEALETRALQLMADMENATEQREQFMLVLEARKLEAEVAKLPRGIVNHPALIGRELSWSTARIDFWFNQLNELKKEARKMSGNQLSEEIWDFDLRGSQISTWQFYEHDFKICLSGREMNLRELRVISGAGGSQCKGDTENHFAVSLFVLTEDAPPPEAEPVKGEENVYRMPKLERKVQGMLDWLASNHHDFIRLNDFSEAFALFRWLKKSNSDVWIVDLGGAPIASPDHVILGDGPKIQPPAE